MDTNEKTNQDEMRKLLTLLAPIEPTTEEPVTGPLTLQDFRYLARLVANQAAFAYEPDKEVALEERHGANVVLASRGLRSTDAEQLILDVLSGELGIEDEGVRVTPDQAFAALGPLGEQAAAVAFVITTLHREHDIALDPLATPDERGEARACRWDGFTYLRKDFPRAIEDARGVASVAADIEARRRAQSPLVIEKGALS